MSARNQSPKRLLPAVLAALALAGFSAACGDDDDELEPGGPNLNIDSGALIDAGGGDGSVVVVPDAGGSIDGGGGGETCRGANGCYSCKPSTNLQLLNACAEGCQPFNNAQRLPGYEPGKLPPLQ